jgi:hypothetical protein
MSWFHRRKKARLTDHEIELLVSGSSTSDEHADLQWFLATLGDVNTTPPYDAGQMATALASVARSSRPAVRPRRALRRLAAVAASVGLLFAMSGIALAADGSAPGDFLYGVDRAFELIGVGDGGVDERIEEIDALLDRGDDARAYDLLEEVIESAARGDATKAQAHLEARSAANERAVVAEENVAELHRFIDANKKKEVGVDGKDFGQGVADGAKDKELPDQAKGNKPSTPANNDNPKGPPDTPGTKDETPAEPKSKDNGHAEEPGSKGIGNGAPPEDTGNGNGNNAGNGNGGNGNPDTGPPDNAGKKDK